CVSEDPRAAGLVRYTKRLADRLHASWTALYVETKRSLQLTEEERDRIADTLRLTQALGGEPVTIPGGDRRIADDVVGFAQANNITQIVLGKSTRSAWFELLHGSVVRDLLRCCGNISVHVIAGEDLDKETIPRKTVRTADRPEPFNARPYGFALLAVAVATSASALLWPWIGTENTDLVYLTAVVGVAARFGFVPSALARAASQCASACGLRCWRVPHRRCATISSSPSPITPSPSPIRGTSLLSYFSPSWRWWCPMSRRGR